MEMPDENTIYVLLTDTGTMFTKMVKRFTSAPYNHASLALDASLNEMFSFGRKQATNPWIAGFVEEDVYEGTFRHFPNTRCALLRLNISSKQHQEAIRMIRCFQQERNLYRYNLIGLFFVLMKLNIKFKRAFFCSQFVAEILRSTGLKLWERSSTLVSPHDFLMHPEFEVVYEGLLYDYPLLDRSRLVGSHNVASSVIRVRKQAV